jgi:alkylation response protein AidB-like acyl-CoA dehydrogenase
MDFAFAPEDEQFRAELRAFLAEELPAWWRGMFVDDDRAMPFTRAFCRTLAARGWLTMAWPRQHGGAEASVWRQAVLREEMWAHDEPRGPQYMNLNYLGPCLMRFGSEAQKRRFLPPMAAGDVLWTQGFSEPGAGSDLAAVATRAERTDGGYVVTGQKTWNSYADAPAEWCFLLARTARTERRHEGLSVLLVDMRTPGVTVRPIDTMAGPHEFNEIFFDGVPVPDDCRLGAEGQGWEIVTAGLAFERVGIARYARAGRVIELLVEHVLRIGSADDPDVRAKLADLRVRYEAARLLNYRAVSVQATGRVPTVEAAIARVHNTQLEQLVGHVGLELLGLGGLLTHDEATAPLRGLVHRQWVRNVPTTIAAGTLEIQKNLIARHGLGLPRSG